MIPAEHREAFGQFPAILQELVLNELRAGNSIVEIGSGHPAPMFGACLRLANLITTRPRASDEQLQFVFRNGSSHSSEISNAERAFFVLEPPSATAGDYPDGDAIRAEMEARQRAADADMSRSNRS